MLTKSPYVVLRRTTTNWVLRTVIAIVISKETLLTSLNRRRCELMIVKHFHSDLYSEIRQYHFGLVKTLVKSTPSRRNHLHPNPEAARQCQRHIDKSYLKAMKHSLPSAPRPRHIASYSRYGWVRSLLNLVPSSSAVGTKLAGGPQSAAYQQDVVRRYKGDDHTSWTIALLSAWNFEFLSDFSSRLPGAETRSRGSGSRNLRRCKCLWQY